MDKYELQDVIAGCKKNRLKDQEKFYKHFYGYAMSVCLIYSDQKEDAVEILNDGFMKIFKYLKNQKEQGSLKSWIRRIMINTAIDHYRKNKKFRNQQSLANDFSVKGDHEIYGNLTAAEILSLVKKLPNAHRTVFNLYVLEGYSHKEIAESLGISPSTSRSNLSYANKQLRKLLGAWLNLEYLK